MGFSRVRKNIEKAKKVIIKVGVQSDAGVNSSGVNIVDYATANEFGTLTENGTTHIPQRSFLYSAFDDKNGWKSNILAAYDDVITGKSDAVSAMEKVGNVAVKDVVYKINKGDPDWKALSPETVKRKKSSRPLIDKGFLKKSISYLIEREN